MDGEDFPEIFVPVATAHAKVLADLRKRKDLNWTYISPAADFQADGERTARQARISPSTAKGRA
ncbi:MAG TPA: hypothetical protein DCP49_08810 [Erysipelotrichaceae bacterium]|nr:hypothetical protein [Erysipelotrichaceae bacterium]